MHRVYTSPWLWAITLVAALCGVGVMDQHDARQYAQDAWAPSQARIDATLAQAQAEQDAIAAARRQTAAQALCSADMGEALAVWTSDTTITCMARRGRARHMVEAP